MSSKGEETRERIVERARTVASRVGLSGLTIGELAGELGLSKSGLFAHFNSKEALQLAVLESAAERFKAHVVIPALAAPRGEPRLRALFDNWLSWATKDRSPGGCIFVAASTELDDQPGTLRKYLASLQGDWLSAIERAVAITIEEGHFAEHVDAKQFAFELQSLALGFHHIDRLLAWPDAVLRAKASFERLMTCARPSTPLRNPRHA